MPDLHELEHTMPVAPLKLVALPSAQNLAHRIDDYLVSFRKSVNNKVKNDPAFHGYIENSYLTNFECPRFGSGEAKAVFHESIRGKDLFIITCLQPQYYI